MSSQLTNIPSKGMGSEGQQFATSSSSSTSSLASRRPPLESIQTHRAQARYRPSTKVATTSFVSNSPASLQHQQQCEQEQQQQPLATSLPYYPSQQTQQQQQGLVSSEDVPHSSSLSPSAPASSFSSPPHPLPHPPATTALSDAASFSTPSPHTGTPGTESFPLTPSTAGTAYSPSAATVSMAHFASDSADATTLDPLKQPSNDNDHRNDTFDTIPLSPTQPHSPAAWPSTTATATATATTATATATSHDSVNENIPNFNASPAVHPSVPATDKVPPASSSLSSSSSPSPIASPSSIPDLPPLSSSRAAPGPSSGGVTNTSHSIPRSSLTHGRHRLSNAKAIITNLDQQGNTGATSGRTSPHGLSHSKGGTGGTGVSRSSSHYLLHHSHSRGTGGGGPPPEGDAGNQQPNGLPTLWHVLHRKAPPPVCLYNFYVYMRDYERSSEQVDFWLDVTTHEVLWRLYVRTLRRKEARERAEERQLAREREEREREQRAAAAAAAADQWQRDQEEAARGQQPTHKSHKSQSSLSLEMIKPHWTVAKRFLDMSREERQEYGEQTGLRWEDVKDVMMERAKLEEAREQIEEQQRQLGHEEYLNDAETDGDQVANFNTLQEIDVAQTPRRASSSQRQQQHGTTHEDRNLKSKTSSEPILLADTPRNHHSQHSPQSTPPTPRSLEFLPTQDESSSSSAVALSGLVPRSNSTIHRQSTTGTGTKNGTRANSAPRSPSSPPRRGVTKGLSGMAVTREEVLQSAERIYLKYLTPQAERHVYIPPSVRQRIAVFMDGYLMNSNKSASSPPPSSLRSEQRSGGGASGVGNNTYKEEAPQPGASSSASPGNTEKKGLSKNSTHTKSLDKDAGNEKQKLGSSSSGKVSPTATRSKSHTFNSPMAPMRASTTSPGVGRPNSPKGSFQQPQPDQELGLVFSEARDAVFDTMERYYFPRFLRARAYGNMVHNHRVFRLFLGLFFLFLGFTTVFCLIFLNAHPRSKRAWALIPIFLGVMLCTTFQFNLCPILTAFNVSETKLMQFAKNKEPYIIRLHRRRALKVVVIAVLYTVCLSLALGFIPGHRL